MRASYNIKLNDVFKYVIHSSIYNKRRQLDKDNINDLLHPWWNNRGVRGETVCRVLFCKAHLTNVDDKMNCGTTELCGTAVTCNLSRGMLIVRCSLLFHWDCDLRFANLSLSTECTVHSWCFLWNFWHEWLYFSTSMYHK